MTPDTAFQNKNGITLDGIIAFMIPDNDFLITWLSILVVAPLVVILLVELFANGKHWKINLERRFANRVGVDEPDSAIAEPGSANDVFLAVATMPEKVADATPGLLLIFGLLGTFLGLGLALDQAADAINLSHLPAASVDPMSALYGVIGKIGAKFKTSTWGLIDFMAFRWWILANGFEERRLNWCMDQINANSEKRLQLLRDNEMRSKRASEFLADQTASIAKSVAGMNYALRDFLEANAFNMDAMKQSAGEMASAASKLGATAEGLKDVIGKFDRNVSSVLKEIKTDLSQSEAP